MPNPLDFSDQKKTAPPTPPDKPAPTTPPIHRMVWIGGGIALGLFACLFCAGAGIGLSFFFNVGPLARPGAGIIGKWALVNMGELKVEFRSDGTGSLDLFGFPDEGVKQPKVQKSNFKWHVENGKSPLLIIEPMQGFLVSPAHFNRDGNILTLTHAQDSRLSVILRRLD